MSTFMAKLSDLFYAAHRSEALDYVIESIEMEGSIIRAVVDSDDGVFFFEDQVVEVVDGCVEVMPVQDPEVEEEYFGGLVELHCESGEKVTIEFSMLRPITREDMRNI